MYKKYLVVISLLLITQSAQAAVFCGSGTIIDLKEGGWNQEGFAIRLAGSQSQGGSPTTLKYGDNGNQYVWYREGSVGENRLDAIRRAASLAFAMRATVWTVSHNDDCSDATEISVLDW